MNTNETDKKYKEIFDELKEDQLNWKFEDFLAKTEKKAEIIPMVSKSKGGTIPKIFLMAASLVLLVSLAIIFKNSTQSTINEKDDLVKNEILKQKGNFGNGNEIVAMHDKDTLNVVSDSLLSDSTSVKYDADVIEKILPKRGRIRRPSRPQYVQNSAEKSANKQNEKKIDYQSNYVIINGQKIENEQEAIDLTKYSFRILSENVSKTVASTEAVNSYNNDY
jgi:hypothetical protein